MKSFTIYTYYNLKRNSSTTIT